tara:strand:+ start:755 stop:1042 length:288 start_codon:yes stop_codon:yes gene_type:complete
MKGIRMKAPTVTNMTSNNGNKVPNQFIIWTEDAQYFQSYQTVIAKRDNEGNIYLDKNRYDYSVTTSRYRNKYLNMTTKEIEKKISVGEIVLTDLN